MERVTRSFLPGDPGAENRTCRVAVSAARFLTVLVALTAILFATACENALTAVIARDEEYSTKLLQATTTPATSHWITGNETITIQFADPVDTASLVMSGTLGIDESDIAYLTWRDTTYTNDTLDLRPPSGLWPAGAGGTLVVSADSTNGKVMNARIFSFTVEHRVCVNVSSAESTVDGSYRYPYKTIQAGIDAVASLYAPGAGITIPVLIAYGTYGASCAAGTSWVVNLKNRISLHGSYRTDFTGLHPSERTILLDTGSANGGAWDNPKAVFYSGTSVTGTPAVDNLTVQVAREVNNDPNVFAGVHVDGSSPVFTGLVVTNPYTSDGAAAGVLLEGNCSPSFVGPYIDPGAAVITFGMHISGAQMNPTVTGTDYSSHIIDAGDGTSEAASLFFAASTGSTYGGTFSGLRIQGPSSLQVEGANILLGANADGGCVYILNGGPSFSGNRFAIEFTGSSSYLFVLFEAGANADPKAFSNNEYYIGYSGDTIWYYDHDKSLAIHAGNYSDPANTVTIDGVTALLMAPAGHANFRTVP